MLVENQKVQTTWNPLTKQHYIDCGYKFTKMHDVFWINIKDLPLGSKVKVDVICDFCGSVYQKTYKDYFRQHENGDCCIKCEGKKSLYATELKYGKNFRGNKLKEITLERYGVNNIMEVTEIKGKVASTTLDRYGVKSALCKDYVNKKQSNSWNEESRQKRIQTNLNKYGYESPLSSPEIREKINQSFYRNGTQKTSSQQIKIFKMLKDIYVDCELNYLVSNCFLDCLVVVNDIRIDVEYDGEFWHQDKQKDRKRDEFLKSLGYKILRIKSAYNIPSIEELKNAIDILVTTNKKYTEIQLS